MSTADWKSSRLGDPQVSEILMGQSPPSSSYNEDGRGLPFFQGKADFGQLFPTIRKWCNLPSRVAERGDILISVRAPVGDVNFSGTSCCIGRGLAAIRPSQNIDARFLFFRLLTLKSILKSRASGTIFESINGPTLRDLEVSYPPLYEQKLISGVLWKIQQAIEVETNLIRVTRELKAAVMKKLFTEGLNREPQKESEIGMVPESWEVRPLGEISTLVSGGTPSKANSSFWDGDIPWVSPKDMKKDFLFDTIDHISFQGAEDGSRIVPRNTLFVVIRGMILAKDVPLALIERPMAFNQDMKGILVNDSVDPVFLLYALQSSKERMKSLIGTSAHGTKTLGTNALANFLVPVTQSKEEQSQVAKVLRTLDDSVLTHQKKLESLEELFSSLLTLLMSGTIRVSELKIDTSVLEQRIPPVLAPKWQEFQEIMDEHLETQSHG